MNLFYQIKSSSQSKYKSIFAITKTFESTFCPYCLKEWNNLCQKIRNIESANISKKTILNFVRPNENSVFAIHDTNGIKLLTRLKLNFTHLNYDKFSHAFRDMIDPMYKCGKEAEAILSSLSLTSQFLIIKIKIF